MGGVYDAIHIHRGLEHLKLFGAHVDQVGWGVHVVIVGAVTAGVAAMSSYVHSGREGKSRFVAAVWASAVVLVGGAVFSGISAADTSVPKGGPVQVILQPAPNPGTGKIIITGAIGDYGPAHQVQTTKGLYWRADLSRGTIELDLTALGKAISAVTPMIDSSTCSAEVSASAPVTLSDGTGLYRGVRGNVMLTEAFAFVTPRSTSGKHRCDESAMVSQLELMYGTGRATFG